MKEFEYIVLNNLCNNGEYFNKILPILKEKYFSDIGNKEIFKIIKNHYAEYKENPNLVDVITKVKNISNNEMRELIKNSIISINSIKQQANIQSLIDETINFVKDSLYLEALRIGSDGLSQNSDELKIKAQQILEERSKICIDENIGLDFDNIMEMIEYYQERKLGIKTHLNELNKRLGEGFIPGTISLIMAASGIGKSLLMTDLISGMLPQGKNVLLITLEMSDKETMKRVHANVMDLPINSLTDINKTQEELEEIKLLNPEHEFVSKERILEAYEKFKNDNKCGKLFIKDYPSNSFTPLMLEQLIQKYWLEKGIKFDIVFVDYLGIAKSDLLSPSVGLYSYIKSIVEEFRSTAKKLHIPIISASQLNRGAVNNTDADNSSVSDSMGSIMTADFIMFLLQNEEMKLKNEIVAKVTKNRFNGRTDTFMLNVDYSRMRFKDVIKESDIEKYIPKTNSINEDFSSIMTEAKNKKVEEFVQSELIDINKKAQKAIKEHDIEQNKTNDIDSLLNDIV